jgi:hypothetical protein
MTRWACFRTILRLAFRSLTPAWRAPTGEPAQPDEPPGPDDPFLFGVDGVLICGWRSLDGTAIVPAPGPTPPPSVS